MKKSVEILDRLEDELVGIASRDPSLDISPTNPGQYDESSRKAGYDWPKTALSMIGKTRMHQLRQAVETVLQENVPGDLIETGVWRGGACVMMRAVLSEYRVTDRKVYIADSFCGLPTPDPDRYPEDRGDPHHTIGPLSVSLDEVKSHFTLPDPQIEFVQGWFKDTLPKLDATFALIRLDGDMYESTMDALVNLYDKVSLNGFIIVDDWGAVPGCQKAVQEFRRNRNIQTPIIAIDWGGVYWRKATAL